MEKIELYYSVKRVDTDSLNLLWFLSEEDAIENQEKMDLKWEGYHVGKVESFKGSGIHLRAIMNSWLLNNMPDEELLLVVDPKTYSVVQFADYEDAKIFAKSVYGEDPEKEIYV